MPKGAQHRGLGSILLFPPDAQIPLTCAAGDISSARARSCGGGWGRCCLGTRRRGKGSWLASKAHSCDPRLLGLPASIFVGSTVWAQSMGGCRVSPVGEGGLSLWVAPLGLEKGGDGDTSLAGHRYWDQSPGSDSMCVFPTLRGPQVAARTSRPSPKSATGPPAVWGRL